MVFSSRSGFKPLLQFPLQELRYVAFLMPLELALHFFSSSFSLRMDWVEAPPASASLPGRAPTLPLPALAPSCPRPFLLIPAQVSFCLAALTLRQPGAPLASPQGRACVDVFRDVCAFFH